MDRRAGSRLGVERLEARDVPAIIASCSADMNGDDVPDLVSVHRDRLGDLPIVGTLVYAVNGLVGRGVLGFAPAFEASFTGEVHLAAGDLDGDGRDEVVLAPGEGGAARVRVLSAGPSGL